MARTVGPAGRVWAFEPAPATARLLAEGIAANGFGHVVLDRSAVSDRCGTARLRVGAHAELNALADGAEAGAVEAVPVVSLDHGLDDHGWRDIAFVKIDAEGEESNIIKGGRRFFAELSPLVQYEVTADAVHHWELTRAFATLGYMSYRLVPGLGLLIPFNPDEVPDPYLLNLFCCKSDRAERLASCGALLSHRPVGPPTAFSSGSDAWHWRNTIAKLPYGIRLSGLWEQTVAAGASVVVETALGLYTRSRDVSVPVEDRFQALESSFLALKSLCHGQAPSLRLASLARVARDYGARATAVSALRELSAALLQKRMVAVGEPFLAPGRRFDSVPPGTELGDWVLASVLEELERLEYFSSYYAGPGARQRLETVQTLGLGGAAMARRWDLLRERFDGSTKSDPNSFQRWGHSW
jgi:FkbM family methyltransferase